MKKTLLYLAALAGLTACVQDLAEDAVVNPVEENGPTLTITATLDDTQTRVVTEDGLNFKFEAGSDRIGVFFYNGGLTPQLLENVAFKAGAADEDGNFNFTQEESMFNTQLYLKQGGTQIFAYAPYADVDASLSGGIEDVVTRSGNNLTLTRNFNLPSKQNNATDATGVAKYYTAVSKPASPAANADGNFNVNLNFSGIFSLIKFTVKNSAAEPMTVSSVKFTAGENDALTGLFTADLEVSPKFAEDNGDYTLTPVEGRTYNFIEINLDEPVTLAQNGELALYGVVNCGKYTAGVTMDVMASSNGRNYIYSATKTSETVITRQKRDNFKLTLREGEGQLQPAEGLEVINTVEDLKALATAVNGGESKKGITVVLGADLDLKNEEWTPIGTKANPFSGVFDGDNHTISNLKITGNNSDVGLFGYATVGEIKNLTVCNAEVSGYLDVAAVVGSPYTCAVTDVKLTGLVKVDGFSYVGGVGGKNAYRNWTNVTIDVKDGSYVKAMSNEYRTYVGGALGYRSEGNITFENVTSNIDVIGSTVDVGGLVGIAHYGNKFVNCSSSGNVSITNSTDSGDKEEIGGIAGVWMNSANGDVTFTGCSFSGTLTTNRDNDLSDNTIVGGKYYRTSTAGKLIIDGKVVTAIKAGENYYETLEAALKAGETEIKLAAGEFVLPSSLANGKETLSITGAGDKTVISGSGNASGLDVKMNSLKWTSPNTDDYDTAFTHAKSVTFEDCSIVGEYYAQSWAPHTFTRCIIDPQTSYLYTYASDCTFDYCTFNSSEGKALQIYAETYDGEYTVNINNCTFTAAKVATTWDVKPVTAIDINSIRGNKFIVNVTGSSATGYGVGLYSGSDLWNIKGGAENVTLTIDGVQHIANGLTYDPATQVYSISKAEGLVYANDKIFANGGSFKLTENIDMAGVQDYMSNLKGVFTFDGNGKTISNWSTKGHSLLAQLCTGNAIVKNLSLVNCAISDDTANAYTGVGFIIGGVTEGVSSVEISGVTVTGGSISSEGNWSGALIGVDWGKGAKIEGCSVTDLSITGMGSVAGLVGYNQPSHNITKCSVDNCTFTSTEAAGDWRVGALIATIGADTNFDSNIVGQNTYSQPTESAGSKIYGKEHNYSFGRISGGVLTIQYYLAPNSNWRADGARFAAYCFEGDEEIWYNMTAESDGTYTCRIPVTYKKVIFCRMNGATTENNWDNKWDQTGDIAILRDRNDNRFTINEGEWNNANGTWSLR